MKKTLTLLTTVLLLANPLFAQEKGDLRLGVDLGLVVPKDNLGTSIALESKYNLSKNISVGLKSGVSIRTKELDESNPFLTGLFLYEKNTTVFCLGLVDYYIPKFKTIRPFVGLGAGWVKGMDIRYRIDPGDITNSPMPIFSRKEDGQFGVLFRGGIEYHNFKLSMEYYALPDSKVTIHSNEQVSLSNQFLNVTIGYFIGIGKGKEMDEEG